MKFHIAFEGKSSGGWRASLRGNGIVWVWRAVGGDHPERRLREAWRVNADSM
jgi:hypothetical protein